MEKVFLKLREWDGLVIAWLRTHVITLIQLSTGLIYVVFGGLKLFPNYSPAQDLGVDTVQLLTSHLLTPNVSLTMLAIIEVVIGLGLLLNFKRQWMIRIALWHMACTFLPLVFLPDYTFTSTPFSLSLVGQYILKNLVIVGALLAVYSHSGQDN
ncbi:MAG: doxx family protein [Cyclobacteriaceae bacterium]